MIKRNRHEHSPAFKAEVALAALKGDKTPTELARQFTICPNQVMDWKKQLQERAASVFEIGTADASTLPMDMNLLHTKIMQLTLENLFLEGVLNDVGVSRSSVKQ